MGPPRATPALLNTMCTRSSRRNDSSASAVTSDSDETSHCTPHASTPAERRSSSARPSASASTSANTTRAPRAANRRAVSRPIPLAPPVTTAPLPANVSMGTIEACSRRIEDAGRQSFAADQASDAVTAVPRLQEPPPVATEVVQQGPVVGVEADDSNLVLRVRHQPVPRVVVGSSGFPGRVDDRTDVAVNLFEGQ